MDKVSFPQWAPKELVKYYKKFFDRPDYPETWGASVKKEILIKLTTEPGMEKVWKRLYKYRFPYGCDEYKGKQFGNGIMSMNLYHAIESAYFHSSGTFTTRNEDIAKYQEIAKLSRQLSAKLTKTRLNKTPFAWFPDTAINTILENDINPDKASGFFCLIDDIDNYFKRGCLYQEVKLKDLSGKNITAHWKHADDTKEFFLRYAITPDYPDMSQILTSLAQSADEEAQYEAKRKRLAKGPSVSRSTVFIRSLLPFWKKTFTNVQYGTFATIIRIILDDTSVSEQNVRDAIKGFNIENL